MEIPLIKITQWLNAWDAADWAPDEGLGKPTEYFFVGSIRIDLLRKLAGVRRRDSVRRQNREPIAGYQRVLDKERAEKIHRYMFYGFPLSSQPSLDPEKHKDLMKPGWLPQAVLINLIPPGGRRPKGKGYAELPKERAVSIEKRGEHYSLNIPKVAIESVDDALEPIEIIDGQHRLFSLENDEELPGTFELPVVIFNDLTPEWQAYLFWVINVEPKKINTSLAFDLYPELRNQKWLERGETVKIYQEHRAQEMTETLWRHPQSPWHGRIELQGRRIDGHVSNAAMIRSLMSSYVRKWGPEDKVGGLFGSVDRDGKSYVIRWTRNQHAAFLIFVWKELHKVVKQTNNQWTTACREHFSSLKKEVQTLTNPYNLDPAFADGTSLLATDQGVRAILVVTNAILQSNYASLGLMDWESSATTTEIDDDLVEELIKSLDSQGLLQKFVHAMFDVLVRYVDWRTSAAPGLSDEAQKHQAAYRGSSGYRLLQKDCLLALKQHSSGDVKVVAGAVLAILKME